MKIKSLSINKYISAQLGLRPMCLPNLGKLVVLVGENGCGKSRLLSVVDWWLREVHRISYKRLNGYRSRRKEMLAFSAALFGPDADVQPVTLNAADDDLDAIKKVLDPLDDLIEVEFESEGDEESAFAKYCRVSDLLRGNLALGADYNMIIAMGMPRGNDTIDQSLVNTPLIYVQDICKRYFLENEWLEERIFGFQSPDAGIDKSYRNLQEIIREVSALELTLSKTGEPLINGFPISKIKLSNGQFSLLRTAILIHSNILNNLNIPILFDEPELSLHPSTLNRLFDSLIDRLPKAQIWIATHSLALTAHLSVRHPRSVWFGKEGEFTQSKRNPEDVVKGLLGGTNGAMELADFCTRAEHFAMSAFAAECLIAPVSLPFMKSDPQIAQIQPLLLERQASLNSIVDFGAGQGRLIEGLAHAFRERGRNIADEVSYFAIDHDEFSRKVCSSQIAQYFQDRENRVFNSCQHLLDDKGASIDVVFMINVLHEVKVEAWLSDVFGPNGIGAILKPSGKLVIVEDTRLPRGELAHPAGYLVLEQPAIRRLFGLSDTDSVGIQEFIGDERYGTRLQATVVDASLIGNVCFKTIMEAFETQKQISLAEIRNLRATVRKPSYETGRLHAYHAHLVGNMSLAIDILQRQSEQLGG